jgi:hypothetical protein
LMFIKNIIRMDTNSFYYEIEIIYNLGFLFEALKFILLNNRFKGSKIE